MRVMHVVATAQRRGAEVFASDLVSVLKGTVDQRVFILRGHIQHLEYEAPVEGGDRTAGSLLPGVGIDAAVVGRLRRALAEWRPTLVQAHGGEPFKYAVAAAIGRGLPIVYRRIGAAPAWLRQGVKRRAYGRLMRRASYVVCVAEAIRAETLALFDVFPDRTITIPNGVDVRRTEPQAGRSATRRTLGIAPSAKVVLSLGSLGWEKDPLSHVEVASRVLSSRPDVVHLIVGDGPLRVRVVEHVRARGLQGRVQLTGARSDVGDLLAASDVLLFASRPGGMEGMPAQVIEAGMAGVPVVGYSLAGLPEVVVDGETGLLATAGDIDALAENVGRLMDDPRLRRSMGAAARARCRPRFNIQVVGSRYLSLYALLEGATTVAGVEV